MPRQLEPGGTVVVVPAGSILVLRTLNGQRIDLLTLGDSTVGDETLLDVLVPEATGDVERGMVEVPTSSGLLHLAARLRSADGQLRLFSPHATTPLQRRTAPRLPVELPLRGAALLGGAPTGADIAAPRIRFSGHTIDIGSGGLHARLIGEDGRRLPQNLGGVFVELSPGTADSIAVALNVVTFRSDVLRARFSFISLADWIRLRGQAGEPT